MLKLLNILVPFLFIAGCGMKPSIEDAKLSDRVFLWKNSLMEKQ